MDVILILLLILLTVGSYINIKIKEKKYKKIDIQKLLSGFEVSRKILDSYDLNDLYITESRESIISYYDPQRNVIRLIKGVFNDTSITSCAISSLESAHAIQNKKKNSMFIFRKNIMPFIKCVLYLGYIVIAIGAIFGHMRTLLVGISLEYFVLLFHVFTYKIEKEATEIAKNELIKEKIVTKKELPQLEEVLKAISLINIASIILPIAELVKKIIEFGNSNR